LKISNESKVGAFTAIGITLLILGYNFMANEGDIFKSKSHYIALYDEAPGLNKGNKIIINGLKVGFVKSVNYDAASRKIVVDFKITEKVEIPVKTVAKIISEDLLGTKAIRLFFSNEQSYHQTGDTLLSDVEITMTDKIGPIVGKTQDMMEYLDSVLIRSGKIEQTIDKTKDVMVSIETVANKTSQTLAQNQSNIQQTLANLKSLSATLNANKEELDLAIKNFSSVSTDLKEAELGKLIENLNSTIVNIDAITSKIEKGEGTMGKLVNDEAMYSNLNQSLANLDRLLKDLNKYPEKYIPMPWGKSQRKKAKIQSASEPYNQ
jgi:phospholipid/cholesterol/gamma-HCH transport system substrate-binding protein